VFDIDFGWDLIEFSFNGVGLYFFPVCFVVSLDWLGTEFPWTFYSSFFLHTVVVGSVVDLNLFEVRSWTQLLEC